MKNSINVNTFKTTYCDTLLQQDNQLYFKVPVKNYYELQLHQHYLIKAIQHIAQTIENATSVTDVSNSIYYLCNIANSLTLLNESDGIDRL